MSRTTLTPSVLLMMEGGQRCSDVGDHAVFCKPTIGGLHVCMHGLRATERDMDMKCAAKLSYTLVESFFDTSGICSPQLCSDRRCS